MDGRLRIGSCSWKYGSWKDIVYSAEKGINFLEEYAKEFDSVEVDQWFWSLHGPGKISLPRTKDVEAYAASVPEDFRFSIKLPDSISLSHFRRRSKREPLEENPDFLSADLFLRFLDAVEPLHSRLGPLMLQFEYLNRDKMPAREMFFDRLAAFAEAVPKECSVGVETRNPNYLVPGYFTLLERCGLHHVYLHGYYMPPATEVFAKHGQRPLGTAVLRLHGPDRKGIEERSGGIWNTIVDAKDDELPGIVAMIRSLLSRDVDVYVNVNNHYEGSAPLTMRKIRALLQA